MTINNKIPYSRILILAVVIILSNNCKKDDNDILLTLKDKDGNVYQTVSIGTQVWMAENLKTTKYNDGTDIPLVTDNTAWSDLTTPGYCWYENDQPTYAGIYGALYNWYVVETGKLCPSGWHVPTDAEFTILTDYLGGLSIAGGKLKDNTVTYWESPNNDATNESGFTALPGGYRNPDGDYLSDEISGYFWSSTEYTSPYAWCRAVYYLNGECYRNSNDKNEGLSIRCVKD